MGRIRTALVVGVVSILIWVFAEAESLRSMDAPVEIVFEPEPGSSQLVVNLVDPTSPADAPALLAGRAAVRTTVTFEGAANAVDAAAGRTRRGPLRVSPGMPGLPRTPGVYTVVLADAVRAHPDLSGLGVTVRRAEAEGVRVAVDDLVTQEHPIVVEAPEGAEASPDPRNPVVRVTMRSRDARGLDASAPAKVRVDERSLAGLISGKREALRGLRVEPPAALAGLEHVTLDPPVADVQVTVRARQGSIRLNAVPVHIRLAPAELAKFDVEVPESDRSLVDVTITGPVELIRQIEEKTLPVIAVVPLSFDELERPITSKDATFTSLPSTLKVEVAKRTVRLGITRRPPKLP